MPLPDVPFLASPAGVLTGWRGGQAAHEVMRRMPLLDGAGQASRHFRLVERPEPVANRPFARLRTGS